MTLRHITFPIRIVLIALVAASPLLHAERKGGPQSIPRYSKSEFFSLGDLFKGSSGEKKETPDSTDPEHLEETSGDTDAMSPQEETLKETVVSGPKTLSLLVAVIRPTSGNYAGGTVYFQKVNKGMEVSGRIKGLLPGNYGLSVHRYGDLTAEDGTSAGDLFDPVPQSKKPKKTPDPVGNLERIEANEDGIAEFSFVDTDLTVEGAESIIGRGLVLYRDTSNRTSGETKARNLRVGMAVIGIADPDAKIP